MSIRGSTLVGGGTGFIGKHLISLLKSKGVETLAISRKPGSNTITWDDISKNGLPSGTTSVVNVAGENVLDFTKRWTDSFKSNVYKSRVDTTKLLSKAISKSSSPPNAFIVISGVGIYPPSDTAKYDENSKVAGFDFLSKLCHDWESATHLDDNKSCRVVSIRSGVVLGRNGGMIKNLYVPFFLGLGGPIGSGKQYLPWIHIDDLTSLISFCIDKNVNGIVNGVAPDSTNNLQFSNAFAKSLSRPAFFPAPEFVFNIIYGKERAIMITQGQRVIPKRALEHGFQFKYPDIQSACDSFVK
ncbi:epimerase family protein SDR39U1 [Arctopsyche grandis]|uniref:epimerase family protein SDR39U1 n=1 Tax=Arctopsyche grandis TaxID=121162 RepID=UPI00406D8578